MKSEQATRRRFLQTVASSGVALAGHTALVSLLSGCARPAVTGAAAAPAVVAAKANPWALRPVADASTGLELLELPEGFRYFSFAWGGKPLHDGVICPGGADGMGVVQQSESRITLVRNQEIWTDTPAFGQADRSYDPQSGGGTTTLEVDLLAEKLVNSRVSLSGTCANCSGGVTPWNSWLSCEEFVVSAEEAQRNARGERTHSRFLKPHGYAFEVPFDRPASAVPLTALGQFRHEAVALDPDTGIVYLTEDASVASGFYRFVPERKGNLQAGRLQMLKAAGAPDLRGGQQTGKRMAVSWVDIADPERAHQPGTLDQLGVVMQGIAGGASAFLRLEGVYFRQGEVYFTSTSGGAAGAGQVWLYRLESESLELVYESPEYMVMDYPDQITPLGAGMVLCQDSKRTPAQVLYWLSPERELRLLARNNTEIDGTNYRMAEWSGVCTSADGKWLFANIYTPGFSVAITGPWEQLRI